MLESLLIKVVGLKVCNFTKKRQQHRYFAVDIAKFSRTLFFRDHLAASEQTKNHFFVLVRRSTENSLHRCAEAMSFFCRKTCS